MGYPDVFQTHNLYDMDETAAAAHGRESMPWR